MSRFSYLTCCVNSTAQLIDGMTESAQPISLATFKRRVDWWDWAESQGYSRTSREGLILAKDWHVAFFKSKYDGRPCYYVVHSAIEYIFVGGEPIRAPREARPDRRQRAKSYAWARA